MYFFLALIFTLVIMIFYHQMRKHTQNKPKENDKDLWDRDDLLEK